MNDELTTPIVLKLKKFDDIILPHTSRLSTDNLNDNSSPSVISIHEPQLIQTVSPTTFRVKLKKPLSNIDDDEYSNSNKRTKISSNDNIINNISEINYNQIQNLNEIKQEHCMTSGQLLVKLKKNAYGELITTSNDLSPFNQYTNGHNQSSNILIKKEDSTPIQPHITNMLSNLNDDKQWNNDHLTQHTIVQNHVPIDVNLNPSTISTVTETHTKELLDEALDSVKSVLMQTFRKNLESGGDLNALKSTLGSDEVAEVFLSKLRESLKRDTISTTENEQKTQELMNSDIRSNQTTISSNSINTIISPIMNVVSTSPSASPLPSISTMITKTTSPSNSLTSSPQSSTMISNKRKFSNQSINPNRFDGTTEEELTKRLLSDILQPNLDIVFVSINPSLYAVHKGHHYGGPGNHFWKLLYMSDLIPNSFNADDDIRMPQYGIGFTNIVQRPTKAGSDITKDEITAGAEVLMQKIKMYRPKIVAFNGRGIYEVYAGNKHFHYGKQPDLFPETDTHVFVMPSSSARCSQLPRAEDKLPFYVGLRKLRDFVNGKLHTLNEAEITFPDIKIKDTDDVLQKTVIRISNKPFSELSPETLKTFGDKIPSGQMISKYNPDILTNQTISNISNQQNLSRTSSIDNSTTMNETDAAVLAALASGAFNSSSPSRQSQTIYVPKQPSVSYSSSSLKTNSTGINSRSSTPPITSHTIHHHPQPNSFEPQSQSLTSTNSPIISHQIVVINPNERSTSINPIMNSPSLKDLLSSQPPSTQKTALILPTISSSNNQQLKTSFSTNKFLNNFNEDCLYLRYERESSTTQNSFHFSYIIDDYSSTLSKHLKYVSLNDL